MYKQPSTKWWPSTVSRCFFWIKLSSLSLWKLCCCKNFLKCEEKLFIFALKISSDVVSVTWNFQIFLEYYLKSLEISDKRVNRRKHRKTYHVSKSLDSSVRYQIYVRSSQYICFLCDYLSVIRTGTRSTFYSICVSSAIMFVS